MQTKEDKGTPSLTPCFRMVLINLQCSGGQPCEACAARNSLCDYDASSDQRRKIANQRNVQDLAQAQHDLDHYRHLVGGVIAIFKAGSSQSANDFAHLVRNGADMSSLAAFVRNEVRSTEVLQRAFESIDFHIDGPSDLPSPTQLLKGMEAFTGSDSGSATNYNSNGSPSSYGVNGQMTNGY